MQSTVQSTRPEGFGQGLSVEHNQPMLVSSSSATTASTAAINASLMTSSKHLPLTHADHDTSPAFQLFCQFFIRMTPFHVTSSRHTAEDCPFCLQASAPSLPAASPEAVQQLVAMGFDPTRAAAALQQSHNDVQAALTYLL